MLTRYFSKKRVHTLHTHTHIYMLLRTYTPYTFYTLTLYKDTYKDICKDTYICARSPLSAAHLHPTSSTLNPTPSTLSHTLNPKLPSSHVCAHLRPRVCARHRHYLCLTLSASSVCRVFIFKAPGSAPHGGAIRRVPKGRPIRTPKTGGLFRDPGCPGLP